MQDEQAAGVERLAFTGLVAVLLAPVIAQGLWRPLTHFLGGSGDAAGVTGAALVLAGVTLGVRLIERKRATLQSLVVGGVVAFVASGVLALESAGFLTLMIVMGLLTRLFQWLPPRLPAAFDGLAIRHVKLTALYALMAVLAVVSMARVSIFIGDATRVELQSVPGEKFLETHSCLTAYVRGSELSRQGVKNLYAAEWWHGSHGYPARTAEEVDPFHPFLLDYFAYPPPFLLAMTPLAPLEGDFPAQRALWFGVIGVVMAGGLWTVAQWIEGPKAHRVLLMAPLLFGSLPVLATLQVGNFQIAVVVLSVVAMIAFAKDRPGVGGALLAFTILSKISPGLLGMVLLAQRRWRSAAYTAGFGVVLLVLSLLILGLDPLVSFVTFTLPQLSSGETFAFMDDDPFSILTNLAPFGLPFKLELLGFDVGDPWRLGRILGRVYTFALILLVVITANRARDRRDQAMRWMAVLVLAALQSPFAPGYVVIGLLWAITLLVAEVERLQGAVGLVILWLLLTLPSVPGLPLPVYGLVQSVITLCFPAWLLLWGGEVKPSLRTTIPLTRYIFSKNRLSRTQD